MRTAPLHAAAGLRDVAVVVARQLRRRAVPRAGSGAGRRRSLDERLPSLRVRFGWRSLFTGQVLGGGGVHAAPRRRSRHRDRGVERERREPRRRGRERRRPRLGAARETWAWAKTAAGSRPTPPGPGARRGSVASRSGARRRRGSGSATGRGAGAGHHDAPRGDAPADGAPRGVRRRLRGGDTRRTSVGAADGAPSGPSGIDALGLGTTTTMLNRSRDAVSTSSAFPFQEASRCVDGDRREGLSSSSFATSAAEPAAAADDAQALAATGSPATTTTSRTSRTRGCLPRLRPHAGTRGLGHLAHVTQCAPCRS